jgi:predicted DNA-binding WGR domain protein
LLIDSAKAGRWQEVFDTLDNQKHLVNVRPDVREFASLHQAGYHDNKDVLITLMTKYGADRSLLTGSGLSLLEVAENQGCTKVLEVLAPTGTSSKGDVKEMEVDADEDDYPELKQMEDGSWKVVQKGTASVTAPKVNEGQAQEAAASSSNSPPAGVVSDALVDFPVDKYFPQGKSVQLHHANGTTWHCTMKRGGQFHLMQLLRLSSESYCVWNRWGRAETQGQDEALHFGNLESAVAAFQARFQEKTCNSWENRKKFKQYFGKYTYAPEPGVDDNCCATVSSPSEPVPSGTMNDIARSHELIDLAKVGKWADLFKLLSVHKQLVNVRPEVRDFSILHQAVFNGKRDAALKLLDEYGADPTQTTKFGKSVLEIANEQGYSQIAEEIRGRMEK